MSNLTSCIECGRSVSQNAKKCPTCGSHYPYGVRCELCEHPLKASEAIISRRKHATGEERNYKLYGLNGKYGTGGGMEFSYHHECFRSLMAERFVCDDCNYLFHLAEIINVIETDTGCYESSCPNCGSSSTPFRCHDDIGFIMVCQKCHLPVTKNMPHKYQPGFRPFSSSSSLESLFYHDHCFDEDAKKKLEHRRIQAVNFKSKIEKEHAREKRQKFWDNGGGCLVVVVVLIILYLFW